jgi:hypothetical protein
MQTRPNRTVTQHAQHMVFLRTARTVIDWRGQTVCASRRLGLLGEVLLLVAWGANDKTIPHSTTTPSPTGSATR